MDCLEPSVGTASSHKHLLGPKNCGSRAAPPYEGCRKAAGLTQSCCQPPAHAGSALDYGCEFPSGMWVSQQEWENQALHVTCCYYFI